MLRKCVCGGRRSNSSSREVIFRSESDVIRRKLSVCFCVCEGKLRSERKWLVKHAYVNGLFSLSVFSLFYEFWYFFLRQKKLHFLSSIFLKFFNKNNNVLFDRMNKLVFCRLHKWDLVRIFSKVKFVNSTGPEMLDH